ncbi:MAG TPA: phosphotransferase [Actinocatenispora sp.]
MKASDVPRAVAAAVSITTGYGMPVDDAVVLQDSNRIAVRLQPCGVLARVAPLAHRAAAFEIELAQRLAGTDSLVAGLEPRAEPRPHVRDGFVVTLWRYHEPLPGRELPPAEYAHALARLHAGMRRIDVPVPRFTDRVEEARRLVGDRTQSPRLGEADRVLLGDTLTRLGRAVGDSGADEQLLHGEPHPGNLLWTAAGPLFVDLETCCRGPVEFDLAHAPEAVAEHYPAADPELLRRCRILTLAIVTAWRWDREDDLPNGRELGTEWLDQIRAELRQHRNVTGSWPGGGGDNIR